MAYNSYGQVHRQQVHPQDQSSMRHYADQAPSGPSGRQYQGEDIQYKSDKKRNGYEARPDDSMQNGYMLDSYENPNQGYTDYHGQFSAEPQGPGRGQGRVYQYDERFHNDSGEPAHQNMRYQGGSQPQVDDTRRHAQSKPRERLHDRPTSPELMAWDNPFPTFNSKKKTNKKGHSSLDKEIDNLSLHQLQSAESRPHTSQGTRPRADSRPSTAHGYRQPDRDPPPNPAVPPPPPPQYPATSPLWKDPPKGFNRGYDSDDQQGRGGHAMGPMRPGVNPLQPNAYQQTTYSLRNQAFSELEQPLQRSMTMPETTSSSELQGTARNPAPTKPYWPDSQRSNHDGRQRTGPQPSPYVDSSQFGPVPTRSRSNETGQLTVQDDRIYQRQPTDHQGYQHQNLHEPNFPRNEGLKEFNEADLPRFDAIAGPPSEKFEDHLQSVPNQNPPQPVYTKKTYQPLQQAREQPYQIQGQRSAYQGDQPPQSFANFEFDLPRSQPNVQEGQRGPTRQRPIPAQNMHEQLSTGGAQYGYEDPRQKKQGQRPIAQLPPQNASRMQQQQRPPPRFANDAPKSPLQESQLGQGRSFSETQQPPFSGQEKSYDRARTGPRQYGEAAYDQPSYNRGQPSSLPGYRGVNDQQYAGDIRAGRLQKNYTNESYEEDAVQPMPMDTSKHPRPVRHYDQRSASGPDPVPPNRPTGPRSPDSLPIHPPPIRPGLVNNGVDKMHSSKNGGGQQQPRTANPQRAIASTSTATSSIGAKQNPPPVTLQELSQLQHQVRTNPNDHATALTFAKKLVEAASVLANEGGKADAKTTARNREKYIFDAHKLLKKLVSAEYPEAMFYLADCHGQGKLGLEVDPREAFSLYQSAAKLNHPQSAYRVAVCCEMGAEEGGGTRRDALKAMQWYKRGAALGDTPAMYKMGMILLKGLLGQTKNPREALTWLKRAAERADEDNPHALHELGLLYESAAPNDVIIRDETYSRQLFTQAAELGYKYSQFRLGSAYEYGMLGCPVDARESIAWYSRAAAQGEHQSELALSGWYLTGAEGLLQQSDTEAYLWARKAANSGLAKAEYAMGYFAEVGIGTPANLEEAQRWYWRSASQNFPKARERLEELKSGGGKMAKTRVSRSAVSKQGEGECSVM